MIARWPGVIPSGQVSKATWWFADIFPTLTAIAGASLSSKNLDGQDILPTLKGQEQRDLTERFLYWEAPGKTLYQAVVRGSWKAIRPDRNQPLQLYHLETDEGERHDLAAAHPKIVAAFESFLSTARTPSPHWPDSP